MYSVRIKFGHMLYAFFCVLKKSTWAYIKNLFLGTDELIFVSLINLLLIKYKRVMIILLVLCNFFGGF